MLNIICWKWKPLEGFRTEFTAHHVNVLYNMVSRNTTIPFKFNCITDDGEGILPEVRIIPLWDDCKELLPNTKKGDKPSCYRRLKVFAKDAPFEDRVVSIDLDCVILGNIDHVLSRPEDFVCLQGTAKRTPYNGGLWSLKVGSRPQVWEIFDPQTSPNLVKKAMFIGSDQGWISYVLGPKEKTYSIKDGVYCFMRDFVKPKKIKLPSNAKMVMFQGNFDPWDVSVQEQYPWVSKYYQIIT